MLAHDALSCIQPQPGALTDGFSRKERFKDVRQNLLWNSGAIVGNLHNNARVFAIRAETELALAAHGVNRVVNDVGPDLIQFAAKRIHQEWNALIVALDGDTTF